MARTRNRDKFRISTLPRTYVVCGPAPYPVGEIVWGLRWGALDGHGLGVFAEHPGRPDLIGEWKKPAWHEGQVSVTSERYEAIVPVWVPDGSLRPSELSEEEAFVARMPTEMEVKRLAAHVRGAWIRAGRPSYIALPHPHAEVHLRVCAERPGDLEGALVQACLRLIGPMEFRVCIGS